MFGIVRLCLALFVMLAHLGDFHHYSSALAVYAFYMLSGYLMTFIMHERYSYSLAGVIKYTINRFLRIYPQYWLLLLLTIIVLITLPPANLSRINLAMQLPDNIGDWLANSFIFGLYPESLKVMPRLVPQAWALHVELVFYVLIGLALGRSRWIVIVWVLASIGYHVLANIYGYPRYSPVLAASLAFSLGALMYFYKDILLARFKINGKAGITIAIIYLVYVFAVGFVSFGKTKFFFYMNFPIFFICLLALIRIRTFDFRYMAIDKLFGDYSYPVYLCHWFVGMVVASSFGLVKSLNLFFVSLPFVFLFSFLMVNMLELRMEIIRMKIKPKIENKQ